MKLEIGGGNDFARGDGWTNMDQLPGADIQHDLNVRPWPLSDDSVDAIYTSHCIEHVQCPISFLHECARIVSIRAPRAGRKPLLIQKL